MTPSGGGSGDTLDVGAAFSYGWQKFQDHMGPILTGMLVLFVGMVVIGGLWFLLAGVLAGTGDAGGFVALVMAAIGVLGYVAIGFVVQAGIIRAALAIVDGRKLEMSTLLSLDRIGPVVITALLIGVAAAIGSLVIIGGIIVTFLAQFALFNVIDRGEGPMDAIMSSVRLVIDNVAGLALLYIAAAVVGTVGALLCGIGLLVAFPVITIAQAWAYRTLNGQPVAA